MNQICDHSRIPEGYIPCPDCGAKGYMRDAEKNDFSECMKCHGKGYTDFIKYVLPPDESRSPGRFEFENCDDIIPCEPSIKKKDAKNPKCVKNKVNSGNTIGLKKGIRRNK